MCIRDRLGEQLLGVEEDPDSANRQIARLKGDLYLETTVTGRRQESPSTDTFLADELVLQILHAPGPPRLSRIETLSRYSRCGEDICAEQWQGALRLTGRESAGSGHRPAPLSIALHTSSRVRSINLSSIWSRHWNRGWSLG